MRMRSLKGASIIWRSFAPCRAVNIAFSDFSALFTNMLSADATTASLSHSSNHDDDVHSHLSVVKDYYSYVLVMNARVHRVEKSTWRG